MSSRLINFTRTAIATVAVVILVFVARCGTSLISRIRGRGSVGEINKNNGIAIVAADDEDGDAFADKVGDGENKVSLEDHRVHRYGSTNHNSNSNNMRYKSHSHTDNDLSFDYYTYSMSYQPEFCRLVGCSSFREEWKGQLTIHGLWPSVREVYYFYCHISYSLISRPTNMIM